jgi:predicted transcriptional regulator YheO
VTYVPPSETTGSDESVDSVVAELAHRLATLRATRHDIEAEEQSIRSAIIDHLEATGESQVFTASGQVAATLRISVRSGINRAKLEAVYPEVFADVVTATRVKSIWLP